MKGIRSLCFVIVLAACGGDATSSTGITPTPTPTGFKSNPCSSVGTLQLTSAQSARIDCSGGGTTVTLAANGASYLVVPQFATDQGVDRSVQFNLASGTIASSSLSPVDGGQLLRAGGGGTLPPRRHMQAQQNAEQVLRARARARGLPTSLSALLTQQHILKSEVPPTPPALGSMRKFHVASSFASFQYSDIGAVLTYAGSNLLIYIDTLAPANGFSPAQLAAFGALFDQTLYPIDTVAFGPPADLDGNGRVIMLMSPTVNADTPRSVCNTQGFVAGFFDSTDFDGPGDPYSNQGEVFYSVVPDPSGVWSCAHTAADLGYDVPATFLHELQHLINFSQHVVVSGTDEGASWMDEGMSIVAEELGSLYYEQKCPPPQCRSDAAQIFPDSSQGFIAGFLYDSYQYALGPDTSSITLHDDSEDGFSWRGGTWLLMRWIGDQFGTAAYRKLERGPSNGVADIEAATGQTFGTVLANFGLALYTDSLPGLPRTTSATSNRFLSRNVKALWARLYATSGGASDVPRSQPIVVTSITGDTLTLTNIHPGTMRFYRLDTPQGQATTTIRFAASGGSPLAASLKPQLAIYRLPSGQ